MKKKLYDAYATQVCDSIQLLFQSTCLGAHKVYSNIIPRLSVQEKPEDMSYAQWVRQSLLHESGVSPQCMAGEPQSVRIACRGVSWCVRGVPDVTHNRLYSKEAQQVEIPAWLEKVLRIPGGGCCLIIVLIPLLIILAILSVVRHGPTLLLS